MSKSYSLPELAHACFVIGHAFNDCVLFPRLMREVREVERAEAAGQEPPEFPDPTEDENHASVREYLRSIADGEFVPVDDAPHDKREAVNAICREAARLIVQGMG